MPNPWRAWRLVGLALDSSDFAIEDQNRAQGLYLVEYRDNVKDSRRKGKGFLARMAFWRKDDKPQSSGERYQVRLAGRGENTVVVMLNEAGEPDDSARAQNILDGVREAIGG